ncbi:MAG TPA: acyl-CoA dehydrogenase family protein [Acidimicrobiia bacterium]|nr:acyl-CoA dehydrogenase family protein [Acidimicrobiia bacterium]
MSSLLTTAELALQDRARAFVDELIPWEVEAEMNRGEIPEDVLNGHKEKARELALTSINMSERLGGPGYSMLAQVLIQEQTGRVTNALGWVVSTGPSWIEEVATDFQLEKWIRPTVDGDIHECDAITEERAGSDVDGIEATARRDGDDYILNGVKWHVTSANLASYVFFQAKLADGPNAGRHVLFFVDMDTPGVECVRVPEYTHTYSHHHWEMSFSDVRVPGENLVGSEGDGMSFSHAWFRYERLMIAARCCGAAERLITEATSFAEERQAYGSKIADYQAIQFMLADSLTELWAARLMTYETARAIDSGTDVKVQHAQCSMAKLYASEMANRVADRAVQIFGGRGFMRENVAERFYRELRVDRIWEGTSEIQRLIIADQLRKRGVGPLT